MFDKILPTIKYSLNSLNLMSVNKLKGDAFMSEAEQKMKGGGLFGIFGGSKKEKAHDAAELYDRAANSYKLDKQCIKDKFE